MDGFLRIDSAKMGLWRGFGMNAHTEINYGEGESLASTSGIFLSRYTALAFPGINTTFADLSLYFTQQLGDSVTVMFGKIMIASFAGLIASIIGKSFLQNLGVSLPTLLIASGLILLLVALKMVLAQWTSACPNRRHSTRHQDSR
jgi:small neutral amino acid transporter SnatA (MarC family)